MMAMKKWQIRLSIGVIVVAGLVVAIEASVDAGKADEQTYCMLEGEKWGLTPEQLAQWDSLEDCPGGEGKVNPSPEDPNYDPLSPAASPSAMGTSSPNP
jgi:hypothetical protein